jgi:hypothetical protein
MADSSQGENNTGGIKFIRVPYEEGRQVLVRIGAVESVYTEEYTEKGDKRWRIKIWTTGGDDPYLASGFGEKADIYEWVKANTVYL